MVTRFIKSLKLGGGLWGPLGLSDSPVSSLYGELEGLYEEKEMARELGQLLVSELGKLWRCLPNRLLGWILWYMGYSRPKTTLDSNESSASVSFHFLFIISSAPELCGLNIQWSFQFMHKALTINWEVSAMKAGLLSYPIAWEWPNPGTSSWRSFLATMWLV